MNLRSHLSSRRAAGLLSVVATMAALILMAPTPAQADTTDPVSGLAIWDTDATTLPSCPTSTLCTFQNSGFGGTRWNFEYANRPHATWFSVGSGANDQISSFYNHRAWTSYFAKNCPADNQWAASAGGSNIGNLANHTWENGTSANDSISAIALGTSTGDVYPAHGGC